MEKLDYKKAEKHLYQPKGPAILRVPEMVFFAVEGAGDPNTSASYREALELLYGLSFTVKISKLGGRALPGYFEYVVPPLEGLWWTDEPGFDGRTLADKSRFRWISLIRQPDFVDEAVFAWAREELGRKRPEADLSRAYLWRWEEGLCAQLLHRVDRQPPRPRGPSGPALSNIFFTPRRAPPAFAQMERRLPTFKNYFGDFL